MSNAVKISVWRFAHIPRQVRVLVGGPLRASEPKGLLWQKDRALGQREVQPSVLPLGYLLVGVTVCTWGHLETSKKQFVWFCTLHGRTPRETGQALAPPC